MHPGGGVSCQVLPSGPATAKQDTMQTNLKTSEDSNGGSSVLISSPGPDTTVHTQCALPHFGKEERILIASFKDDKIQTHGTQVLSQSNPVSE